MSKERKPRGARGPRLHDTVRRSVDGRAKVRANARVLLAAVMMTVALLAFTARAALAHARLKSSSPAAGAHLSQVPRSLRFDFTETVELTFTSIRLLRADGREIALGPVGYPPGSHRSVVAPITGTMEPGVYRVAWQMAGDDGHPVRGQYEFVVAPGAMGVGVAPLSSSASGEARALAADSAMNASMHHDVVSMPEGNGFGADSPLYVLIRWIQFCAMLLVVGAVAFRFFVLGFMRREAHPHETVLADAERRAATIGHVAAGFLGLTLVLRLGAQSFAMHGASGVFDWSLSAQMIRTTTWGWGWLVQFAGILLVWVGFHGARRAARRNWRVVGWWRLAALGAIVTAFSLALTGHASAAPRLRVLAIVADGLHVLGASSWLGTLAVVLVAGVSAARRAPPDVRGNLIRDLINAYSPVALASAGLAASTGVFAAWLHVGIVSNLWGTRYGVVLLLKLGILGVVALTGFYNWRFVKPRLGTDSATTRLRRSARIEVAVAIVVLLVTAVLVATPTSLDATM